MTRTKALILTYVVMMLLVSAAYLGLASVDASEETRVAVIILISCLGAHVLSRVVMRYPSPDERQR